MEIKFERHKYQQAFVDTCVNHRITAAFSGLQGGKTLVAVDALYEQLYGPKPLKLPKQLRNQDIHPEVWIVSKSFNLAIQAWQYFKWRAADVIMSEVECRSRGLVRGDAFTHWLKPSPDGDNKPIRVRVRTAHDPEELRSTGVLLCALCDEAAHWPELAWMNLQGRGIVTPTRLIIATTPKGKNWLYRDVFLEAVKGHATADGIPYKVSEDGEVAVFRWSSADNPWADQKYLEKLAKKFGPDYAAQELEAAFTTNVGYVYDFDRTRDCFDKLPSEDPAYYKHRVIGIDPGYGDPYASGVWLCDNSGTWWLAAESYELKATFSDVYPWLDEQVKRWKIQVAYCDKRRPSDYIELHRLGIPAQANIEIHGETDRRIVMPQIRILQTLLKAGKIRVHRSCEWHCDEFENYAFPDREDRNAGDNPVDFRNHCMDSCLVAGTKVLCDGYEKDIEDVAVGEFVMTQNGLKRVSFSEMVNPSAKTLTVECEDGRTVTGTGNHPFFVVGKGWTRLDKLMPCDTLIVCESSIATGAERSGVGIQTPKTDLIGSTSNAESDSSIERCGNIIMGKSHEDSTSTTATRTHLITTLKILNVSHQANTRYGICQKRKGGRKSSGSQRYGLLPASGTVLQKEGRGIEQTGTALPGNTSERKPFQRPANNAESDILLLGTGSPTVSAQTLANQRGAEHLGLMTLSASALTAESTSQPADTNLPNTALVRVRRVYANKTQPVYDLTVDSAHHFFANGVLVHNTRYAIASVESVGNVDGSPTYRGKKKLRERAFGVGPKIPTMAEYIAHEDRNEFAFIKTAEDSDGPVLRQDKWNPVR